MNRILVLLAFFLLGSPSYAATLQVAAGGRDPQSDASLQFVTSYTRRRDNTPPPTPTPPTPAPAPPAPPRATRATTPPTPTRPLGTGAVLWLVFGVVTAGAIYGAWRREG